MRDYGLEQKIIKILTPLIKYKPKLVYVMHYRDGGIECCFRYLKPGGKVVAWRGHLVSLPDDDNIIVDWPTQQDWDQIDEAYICRRLGYDPFSLKHMLANIR